MLKITTKINSWTVRLRIKVRILVVFVVLMSHKKLIRLLCSDISAGSPSNPTGTVPRIFFVPGGKRFPRQAALGCGFRKAPANAPSVSGYFFLTTENGTVICHWSWRTRRNHPIVTGSYAGVMERLVKVGVAELRRRLVALHSFEIVNST